MSVQRLYSSFATGRPGVALLLLRFGVAVMLSLQGPNHWITSEPLALRVVLWIAAGLLCLGLWTPVVAGLCCLAAACAFLFLPRHFPLAGVIAILISAAVTLLGAGSYSLDGFIYGRRRIVFPESKL